MAPTLIVAKLIIIKLFRITLHTIKILISCTALQIIHFFGLICINTKVVRFFLVNVKVGWNKRPTSSFLLYQTVWSFGVEHKQFTHISCRLKTILLISPHLHVMCYICFLSARLIAKWAVLRLCLWLNLIQSIRFANKPFFFFGKQWEDEERVKYKPRTLMMFLTEQTFSAGTGTVCDIFAVQFIARFTW